MESGIIPFLFKLTWQADVQVQVKDVGVVEEDVVEEDVVVVVVEAKPKPKATVTWSVIGDTN